ncbi:MAG: baseplate hub subunit and tail lysozyme [Gammaproteobacteria bacterium]|nr:baseplate hub subunit and tail lysozyme [Gammaproteobacteria bacterium]
MVAKYQDNRSVKITSPFGPNALLFARMSSLEQLSQPFHCELALLSEDEYLDADKILGKPLSIALTTTPNRTPRHFHGFVTEFAQTGLNGKFYEYRAVIRPWSWFLTRKADCRIFQGKTVPEIFEEVCHKAGFKDLEKRLGSYERREYCVQYRETDFNFLSRLLEQEGIFYFFEHSQNKHVLVLADDVRGCKTAPGYDSVPLYPATESETLRERDHLHSWSLQKSFQAGSFATRDYSFHAPTPVPAGTATISRKHDAARFEIFDYPADVTKIKATDGERGGKLHTGIERVAKMRVQEMQVSQMVARGSGDAAGLAAGWLFTLTRPPSRVPHPAADIQYLITSTSIDLSSNDYHSGGSSAGTQFNISVEAVDAREPYRPARTTPKPVVQGTQTAVVVGPKGEEIYTDEFGRIKVQFHWDRYGKLDENSSCFVRVGQVWAGKNWGALHIPRIGQEVIVSFLEGDPDHPLVIGSVYNGSQKPPYDLPDNMTQSGIKSRSSKGGTRENYSELRFEDKKGSELVYLHAEKDQTIEVENDESHSVGHDRKKDVKNDETTSIGKNRKESVGESESITIAKNRTESVGGNENIDISKDYTQSIGGTRSLSVAKDESVSIGGGRSEQVTKDEEVSIGKNRTHDIAEKDSLSVGKQLLIDVGDQITIQTGEASITMKKDGTITIRGKDITLEGSGKINVKASGDVILKGSKVTQN